VAEKTQKLSPEPEPTGYQFPDLSAGPTATAPSGPASSFETNASFWALCLQNPELRQEFEERVQRAVREKLELDLTEERTALRAQARDEGHKEGFAAGREAGREELLADWEVLRTSWEALSTEFLREKTKLLHSHEEDWTRSFSHLLRRFLIAEPVAKGEALRDWLKESITSFPASARLKARMSARQAAVVADLVKDGKLAGWEIVADAQFQDGQIALDADGGGAFFSRAEQLASLERLIESLWGVAKPAPVLAKAA